MIDDLKNNTEKVIGKTKEMAGKIMDIDEMEFKGKMKVMKSDIKNKVDDVKDEVYEKANNLIDKGKDMIDKKK